MPVFSLPSIAQWLTVVKLSSCFVIKITNVLDSFSLLNRWCLVKRVHKMITKLKGFLATFPPCFRLIQ